MSITIVKTMTCTITALLIKLNLYIPGIEINSNIVISPRGATYHNSFMGSLNKVKCKYLKPYINAIQRIEIKIELKSIISYIFNE
ncbi:MAG: hypothetical protein ACP5QK_12420 [Myxococcota bacterium]